jgi:hypothetical protein
MNIYIYIAASLPVSIANLSCWEGICQISWSTMNCFNQALSHLKKERKVIFYEWYFTNIKSSEILWRVAFSHPYNVI